MTGRTHQLRVHLAAIGHPIRGDSLYEVANVRMVGGQGGGGGGAGGGSGEERGPKGGAESCDDGSEGDTGGGRDGGGDERVGGAGDEQGQQGEANDGHGHALAQPARQTSAVRLLLHAKSLVFTHPATQERTTIVAEVPF